MKIKRLFPLILLTLSLTVAGFPTAVAAEYKTVGAAFYSGEKGCRTELYFGLGKPDGSEVTAAEWDKFLADEVTPRFPSGFTVVDASGQFRSRDGQIIKERSKVLIVLYVKKDRKPSDKKIEEIREAYKKAFQQQSVLRTDMLSGVEVFF